ncbi:general stress protein [Exiguobacterium alkaliphilum]|uniref:general stress protein n=1 Tax=Exiguobacterium alkaliphilum TaxID=1428684 RepID=UPI001BACD901|nr:general stress protein [Exiguobacterium alkaliphilum]QUE86015.1 general stress protein [Exiguobacterium alkaliphilum]
MSRRRFVGTYHDEASLVSKIDQLNHDGYEEKDLFVVVKDEDNVSLVERKTDAKVEEASASWLQKFAGVAEGEQEVKRALLDLGLADDDVNEAYRDILNGGYALILDEPDTGFNDGDNPAFEGHEGNATFGRDRDV